MTQLQPTTTQAIAYEATSAFAARQDELDPLARFRREFIFPESKGKRESVYLCGNSLGLQPVKTREYINEELDDWAKCGVEGHFTARHPWVPYHENVTEASARLVGARPSEVVMMNGLTVNLHLMMVSFYRPTKTRYKILIEGGSFPSDHYAVDSQAAFHGFDPKDAVVELWPRAGQTTLATEDIIETIGKLGDSLALVLLGNVNYLTGQAFASKELAAAAHDVGACFGLNLAHGAGNLYLQLHDWQVDFAVWCSYKYLNSGPGSIAGCFVHERHVSAADLPRFAGWWGHDKQSRFQMGPEFQPIPTAEGWQLSNPPIFQLAALRASIELFDAATMQALRGKSIKLTGFLEYLIKQLPGSPVSIITPSNPEERGCQLSLRVAGDPRKAHSALKQDGVICDFREPDVIRVAPAPLYNSFGDVWRFFEIVAESLSAK